MSSDLTDAGRRTIQDLAARYGASEEAVEQMARAVAQGGGTMAQFNIPEFGGSGQWMAGGMTMVGDMFNYGLQGRVSGVCSELASAMAGAQLFHAPPQGLGAPWWPAELGSPAATGGQNQMRYAYFPAPRRLAVDPGSGAAPFIYDTGEHNIGGFSQQQSGPGDPLYGLTFSSQFGQFAVSSLPQVGAAPVMDPPQPRFEPPQQQSQQQQPMDPIAPPPSNVTPPPDPIASAPIDPSLSAPAPDSGDAVLETIGRLAALRDSGALTDEEFAEKKRELLARL